MATGEWFANTDTNANAEPHTDTQPHTNTKTKPHSNPNSEWKLFFSLGIYAGLHRRHDSEPKRHQLHCGVLDAGR
jgi:hypothetical protein